MLEDALLAASRARAMYRRFLTLAARVTPPADAARVTAQVRAAFRASAAERDPAALASLLATARDKLAYLRTVTPRRAGDGDDPPVLGGGGAPGGGTLGAPGGGGGGGGGTFVVRNGELVRVSAGFGRVTAAPGAAGSATGGALDSNALRRHAASLERFRFGGRARSG
jgi:hypothetical protein